MYTYSSTVKDVDPTVLERLAIKGAERVAKVIDASIDYDAVIGHKITDQLRSALSADVSVPQLREAAVEYTMDVLRRSKQVTYLLPDVDVLFFGRTNNNIREFNFLLDLIDANRRLATANIVDLRFRKASHPVDITESLRSSVAAFYDQRASFLPALVYQVGQFFVHFLRYVFSLRSEDSALPGVAVVANDHSPNPVAFALAMECFEVPRIYLQHAEVSSSFPPLDFEVSILRNNRSKRIYLEVGSPAGEVLVIGRTTTPFVRPTLGFDQDGKFPVVIYTTGRVDVPGLASVTQKLRANPLVSAVYIKPHPNQEPVDWPEGIEIRKAFAEPHLALVGNSSVVIELLHRGIPVMQNFSFDPVEDDYYSFCKMGIVKEAQLAALDQPFWQCISFDDEWNEIYTDSYSPTPSDSAAETARLLQILEPIRQQRWRPRPAPASAVPLQRAAKGPATQKLHRPPVKLGGFSRRLVDWGSRVAPRTVLEVVKYVAYQSALKDKQAMWELRSSDSGPAAAPAKRAALAATAVTDLSGWIEQSLKSSRSPGQWLNITLAAGFISNEQAIRAAEKLHADRHPESYSLFDEAELLEDSVPVFLWLAFKRLELSGVPLPYDLSGMIGAILDVDDTGYVRSSLEALAFSACLRLDRPDLLEVLFLKSKRLKRASLSTNRRIALLRYLIKRDPEEYRRAREEFWKAESSLHRLKISYIDSEHLSDSEGPSHSQIEFAFETSANPAVVEEFSVHVKPVFDRLRPYMRYMDVRSSPSERKAFMQSVMTALSEQRPFSMIRLSDGEGHAFAQGHEFFSLEDQKNRERHWWGMELTEEQRGLLCSRVVAAADRADVLGIPSIHRFVRDTHHKTTTFTGSIQGRGLLQVLHHFSTHEPSALFGEEKMNIPLFRSVDAMKDLIGAAQRCVLVSSAGAESAPAWMQDASKIEHIVIPTHFRTSRNEKYHVADQPLPLIYEDINQQVRDRVSAGTLVLVAGGIIGKVFIDTAKDAGGVALDIGSVMDEWLDAGIHSLH
ncbi:hypothetical protein SAMN05428979_0835 [Stappia sp. ES.058]|nr:hypothetical protein SAMN05428979_0835 [Stappia sp. ES.058]